MGISNGYDVPAGIDRGSFHRKGRSESSPRKYRGLRFLEDYGLDVPGARVTIYTEAGNAQTIFYGGFTHADVERGGIYVKQSDRDAVFLVDAHVYSLFPRSPEALRANAQRWGSVAGFPAAEAFELVRDVR